MFIRLNFVYLDKLEDFKNKLTELGIQAEVVDAFGYDGSVIDVIGEFTERQSLKIESLAEVLNDNKPITYKTDYLIYDELYFVAYDAGNFAQLMRFEAMLKMHPFMILFAKKYSYNNIRVELGRALQEGLITEEDYAVIDNILPIQITEDPPMSEIESGNI